MVHTAPNRAANMTRASRGLLLAAVIGGMTMAIALPASAAPGDTTTTFSLTGGALSVTAQTDAALSNGLTGATTITGSLGTTTVTDARGGTATWTVSATSTAFTGPGQSSSSAVSYDSGAVTHTGTVNPTSSGPTDLTSTNATVVSGNTVSGNNTATFTPTLTVTMPASALAGAYIGTVTTSVD